MADINAIFLKNLVYLTKNLTNITEVLLHLVQDSVISQNESEAIKRQPTSLEQGQELFVTLMKKDMKLRWKSKISKILRNTNNGHLVDKINESLPREQPPPPPQPPPKLTTKNKKPTILVNDDDIPVDPFGPLNSICSKLKFDSPTYEEKGPFPPDSNFECCCTINKETESEMAKTKKQAKRRVAYKWLLILKAKNPC